MAGASKRFRDIGRAPVNYDGKTATQEKIVVDGGSFVHAHLIQCTLIYRGGKVPNLAACHTENCTWSIEDKALNTLLFIAYLEKGQPQSAAELLEKIRRDVLSMLNRLPEH